MIVFLYPNRLQMKLALSKKNINKRFMMISLRGIYYLRNTEHKVGTEISDLHEGGHCCSCNMTG